MVITLADIGIYVSILTASAYFINAVIVAPLRDSIKELSKICKELQLTITNQNERIITVEQATKSAHKRLDSMEDRVHLLETKELS